MKLTKKPELLTIKKSIAPQPPQEQLEEVNTVSISEPTIEQQLPVNGERQAREYPKNDASLQDYPILQSPGYSAWQASDIWRELRIDSFCD